ncbi:MAG: rod shape-determining protein RodA [Gemmatimonadetes bacterium]|nr:rod shape-determining protein RodA [Gemmatimonadota bacterium]
MRAPELDKPLLGTCGALALIGLAVLYSAGQTDVRTVAADIWERQALWLLIGGIGAVLVYRISPQLLEWATPGIYALGLLLLVATLFFGTGAGTAAGNKSWISVFGVRVGQPAELAKLATILMLARHTEGLRDPPNTLRALFPACVIAGIPTVLVALQPDLGSALVFIGILFAVLFWVGTSPWLLLLLASPIISLLMAFSTPSWGIWILLLTAVLIWVRPFVFEAVMIWLANVLMGVVALELWRRLAPYQQNRLTSFLNPESDPRATGWHVIQSKVAIGSGGLLGKGFTEGTQKRLAFLPAQHTDFVYSVVGEEFGFLGVVVTLALFAGLLMVLIRIARRATDPFSCVVVFGVMGMIFTHIVENIGMTIGIMPITGIPLPFFSYGGSFMLTVCMGIGMALRAAREGRLAGYSEL